MTAPDARPPATPGSDAEPGFRPDVEGLRGIAVALVVLFHAGLPLPGGFVGVDVFFVISGFLITGLLIREHERTGRVSLARFYARRIRRLLPAAAVVVVATLAGTWALVGPLDRPDVIADGASAVLSVSNLRFALAEGDYFNAITQPSPFLHFWSLSVEEQFYLAWPALLLFAGRGRRRQIGAVLGLIVIGSFVANLVLTATSINWAFYSLPTRAWQLGLGGLLAVAAGRFGAPGRFVGAAAGLLGWVALATVVGVGLVVTESMPYPGWIALAPTLAAVALIATGPIPGGPRLVLASGPIRFLGRISYSLYLWHWPILVFGPLALDRPLEPVETGPLVGLAVGLASLSWRFVEEPFRHGRLAMVLGTRRALASGLTAIAVVTLAAGAMQYGSVRAIEEIGLAVNRASPSPPPTAPPVPTPSSPAGSPGPETPALATPPPTAPPAPTPTPTPLPVAIAWTHIPDSVPADAIPLPADVRPPLVEARTDGDPLSRDQCLAQWDETEPPACAYGDRAGDFTVALVGDSHAGAWFPGIDALARERGWRLVPYIKLACPFIDARVEHLTLKREFTECAAWRELAIAAMAASPPDLTIVAMSHRGIFPVLASDRGVEAESAAIARAIARLPGPVVMMIDTPRTGVDIPGCIAEHPADVRDCAIPRETAFTRLFGAREARVAELTGSGIVDVIPSVCPAMPCQVLKDGMIVYRDNHHLSATFSRSLAGAIGRALEPYLPPGER